MPIVARLFGKYISPIDRTTSSTRSPDRLFQETKANDGSGNYLYLIDPKSYAVSRVGPYSGILGPYAVDSSSNYVVNNVMNFWGMQVADLKTDQIITATSPIISPAIQDCCTELAGAPIRAKC